MSWKRHQKEIQLKLTLQQNAWLLRLLSGWLVFSAIVLVMTGHPPLQALAILTFFHQDNSAFGYFYSSMTDFVVFGLVISVLLVDVQRRARPETTCRVMAQELSHHAVVFHLTNLGRRTWQLLRDHDVAVAVVDPRPGVLEELIRDGYPCVAGTGRSAADLDAVNIAEARLVIVCSDDLESAAVICSLVRRRNSRCTLVARCADDDIGEVLARQYQASIISTSKVASTYLREYVKKNQIGHCVLIGGSELARRMIEVLQHLKVPFSVVVSRAEDVDDLLDEGQYVVGRYTDDRVLEQANIMETDLAVFTEDDFSLALSTVDRVRGLNLHCKIICRVFMDDAADLLSVEPFRCDIFSSSRQALTQMRGQGAFQSVGLHAQ